MKETIVEILGWEGRMISGSKSGYMRIYPDNMVAFNANLILMGPGSDNSKIWYGDLDVTRDIDKLKQLAIALGESIIVLREMDARFENKTVPRVDNFLIRIEKDGSYSLGKMEKEYFSPETLTRNE